MKLYWSARSPYVRKVMIAAIETGTANLIEKVHTLVSSKAINPAIMQVNPLGKIPTLITDDGQILHDSLVICEYLDQLRGAHGLFPANFDERIKVLTWHALGHGLTDLLLLWNGERLREPKIQSAAHLQAFEAKCHATLDQLDSTIADLSARSFGIGHIAVGVALGYANFRFSHLDWCHSRPTLRAWFDQISRRPSFTETVASLEFG